MTILNNSRRHFLCLIIAILACDVLKVTAQSAAAGTQSVGARRERSLDHFDVETMAFYLGLDPKTATKDPTISTEHAHNVAVLYYAQWDRNSHALAPLWDNIAIQLQAGSKKSNLIMGLFDCELDPFHSQLCTAAGVTYYPTLMWMSPTRTFPRTGKQKKLPHTSIFPGMWQYERSILDWIRTMQGLSAWSSFWSKGGPSGWWEKELSKKGGSTSSSDDGMLPVGVPDSVRMKNDLDDLALKKESLETVVLKASIMVDAMLFPIKEDGVKDTFIYLNEKNGWDSENAKLKVISVCVLDLSLDYCNRLTTQATNEMIVNELMASDMSLEEIEAALQTTVETREPYCGTLEQCVMEGFQGPECRTAACPFLDDAACRYLTSCFDITVQEEYANALGLNLTAATVQPEPTEGKKRKRGWF